MSRLWLVPVNVRYKEYYLIANEETAEEAKEAAIASGDEVESLREYVEAMPIETWDEPEELTEERYQELFEDKETYHTKAWCPHGDPWKPVCDDCSQRSKP